jgi:dolichol-phosphate mannosyltransferase
VTLERFCRFNAVGIAGFAVQLGVVAMLAACSIAPVIATLVGVEAAVLHNFFWHERWTWADRPGGSRLARLARFHAANGLISIVGNVVIVALLAGLNPVVANAIAVSVCSLVNFAAGDRLVFSS